MSLKTRLIKIEKILTEEKIRQEDPTPGDLDLIRLLYTNEPNDERVKIKKREKFKKIYIREYNKFNGSCESFEEYLIAGITNQMRRLAEE